MAESSDRIEQFRKMAEADPENELGHFSLGRAYIDAGQFEQAIGPLKRVVAINPNISKAYQLLGSALLQAGRRDEAIVRLTEGVKIADARGDQMPKLDMVKSLEALGAPVPELKTGTVIQQASEGEVLCKRCGKVAKKLAKPPFRNKFGQEIFDNICTDCWRDAIGQGTKVINELLLPMADPQAQKMWDQHIREFLNLPAT